jgi:hypothetical protein
LVTVSGATTVLFFPQLSVFERLTDGEWTAFVGRKEKNRDPGDPRRGDCWGHAALDPEARLVVSLVAGVPPVLQTEAVHSANIGGSLSEKASRERHAPAAMVGK